MTSFLFERSHFAMGSCKGWVINKFCKSTRGEREKAGERALSSKPAQSDKSGGEQLLCCRQTAVELPISNLIVYGALILNADKFGCEVCGKRVTAAALESGRPAASVGMALTVDEKRLWQRR